jgi:hypothetical protein
MLNKIDWTNGAIVRSDFLKEVQKGTTFSESPRADFYAEPAEEEHDSWSIGSRDKIKEWEIADPTSEPQSALGRLIYDGLVLGYDDVADEVVLGPASLVPVTDGFSIWVEGGSAILSDGEKISWDRQRVQLVSGAQVNYIYLSEPLAQEDIENGDPVMLSIGTSLPSATSPHIPLAKLTLNINENGLLLGTEGEPNTVVGHGYIDLRPSTHIGNLNTYPRNLANTGVLSQSTQISSWKRAIVDTSNGSIIITLPSTPENSDRVAIADISGTFDRYPVLLRVPDDCDYKINGSVDDWIVNIKDSHLELFYNVETNQWKFEESPGGDCNPVLGSFLSCGGKEFIGERLPQECPDGEVFSSSYPNPAQGIYEYEPSSSKCYKKYYDRVAIYANGQGGLITVPDAPRCDKSGTTTLTPVRNTLYVDPTVGDDSLGNTGFSQERPFRTIERALIEATRESHRAGTYNDRYDRVVIELSPGDYYVDNSPGSPSTPGLTASTGLVQRVSTSFSVLSVNSVGKGIEIRIDSNNAISTQPPQALNLGRVLYSGSGGVGNITHLEKESLNSTVWVVTLEYVKGEFLASDDLYYDNLAVVNPFKGGLIVPRGISIDGVDLRKVRVRPMYVPTLDPVEANPQVNKTSIFKLTGGSYVSLLTFTDNPQYARTHNTVTAVSFASKDELVGLNGESSYYNRINSLFSQQDGWESDGLEYLDAEFTIVAPVPYSSDDKLRDIQENQTGLPGGDSRSGSPIAYPGASKIALSDSPTTFIDLPDVNSTRSSSPYVFNCSVRSIFGMNGMHADGALVEGLKSMVTANFTQVSLQTDPNCFVSGTYYSDPPVNEESSGKKYRSCPNDEFKYRNIGFRCSNDSIIQIVSCFVIGNSDHFVADNGGDLSITNSCSDFGDTSLKAIGFKGRAFRQDNGAPAGLYGGTRILEVIPPLPLSYSPVQVSETTSVPTMEDVEISTGVVVDYDETLAYIIANKGIGNTMPSTYRLYCKNSNSSNPFTLSNPPSASDIAYNQFSYTKESTVTAGTYILTGGETRVNRKRLYVNGFDELGNSILFAGNIRLPDSSATGWANLDERSKIFVWDSVVEEWYVELDSNDIIEQLLDNKYFLKKFDYAFRFKLLSSPNEYTALDFFFNNSDVKIIRGVDKRTNDQRVYKTVLSGFLKANGVRRPQSYYILERQSGDQINAGADLANNPVTITQIRSYEEYLNPNTTATPTSGKYVTFLTKGSDSRRVFTNDIYPVQDFDEPEATEDPINSITKQCFEALIDRPGITPSVNPIGASATRIGLKLNTDPSYNGILINLRRPSTIRASNHTWEWTGYLNYDTSLPIYQGDPLERNFALAKVISEAAGGRVYATGMNEEGSYYIGTTVFDLRSGEQFSIPLQSDAAESAVTNQVFSNVIVQNNLLLQDNGSLRLGADTTIYFSSSTKFKSLTTGEITANSNNPPGVYATRNKAGLIQIAKPAEIRGAFGNTYVGVSDQVAVTAKDLADELNVRFGSSVGAGTGITVTQTSVTPPGGGDPVTQFTIGLSPTFGGFTPLGGIIMWTGHGGSVPTGWALCNTPQTVNGIAVPDLSNKFVIGAVTGANVTPQTTVTGSASVTGGTKDAVVVSHSHPITDVKHAHNFKQSNDSNQTVDPNAPGSQTANRGISSSDTATDERFTGINGTELSGTDGTNQNLPPYYALAFICRVA